MHCKIASEHRKIRDKNTAEKLNKRKRIIPPKKYGVSTHSSIFTSKIPCYLNGNSIYGQSLLVERLVVQVCAIIIIIIIIIIIKRCGHPN